MPKLAVIGTIEATPGQRDQLILLLAEHKARCLRDESGTLTFEIMVSNDDETKIHIYEVYENAAAFAIHLDNSSIRRFREQSAGMVTGLVVSKCAPVG